MSVSSSCRRRLERLALLPLLCTAFRERSSTSSPRRLPSLPSIREELASLENSIVECIVRFGDECRGGVSNQQQPPGLDEETPSSFAGRAYDPTGEFSAAFSRRCEAFFAERCSSVFGATAKAKAPSSASWAELINLARRRAGLGVGVAVAKFREHPGRTRTW